MQVILLSSRRQARELAFQILFQLDLNEDVQSKEKNIFTQTLIKGVIQYKESLDQLIAKYLINWTIDRIALVDKTILRIALYEIIYIEDIPYAVSINEALELAHKYGDEHSSKFINGILSKIIKKGDIQQ